MENLAPRVEGARPTSYQSIGMEREGKKNGRMFRGGSFLPILSRNRISYDPFLSRSLFAVLPRLADTVSDKNLGLHVNVGSQLFVFLYGLILWPRKR